MNTTRKEMERDSQRKAEKVKLPVLWKFFIFAPLFWAVLGGWIYASGMFALTVGDCTVSIDTVDEFMATSIAFAGAIGLLAAGFGLHFLENQRR